MPATFLLDTHILLWWLGNTERLPAECLKLLEDKKTNLAISAATVWEIEIKRNLGKLSTPPDLLQQIRLNSIRQLPISCDHAIAAAQLPRHHNDPFDRMLIAQAQLEGMTLITADQQFRAYLASSQVLNLTHEPAAYN